MRNRLVIIFLVVIFPSVVFFAFKTYTKKSSDTEDKPNIVVFLVDDMGYGDPQSYVAASKIPTPNIDELAAEGIKFTDAHSPSSVCSPTRYGILTGRYAWRTHLKKGVLGPYSSPLIASDRLTIPKMLKEKGYVTALVGKWHLGMQWATKSNTALPELWDRNFDISTIDHSKPITEGPLNAGFDYFFGLDVPNFPPYIFIENDKIQGNPSIKKPNNIYGNKGMMLPGWKLEEILPTLTQKAVNYIDDYAKSDKSHPFYLQITTTSPHTPIVPSKEFVGKSEAGPYGDLVHQTDFTLGEVRKILKEKGLLENTLIIFTSDNGSPERAGDPYVHGPEFQVPGSVTKMFDHEPNAPWRGMKADIYEGGHRVPFIVSWPNNIKSGSVSDELLSSIDIMASLATIVDYKLPENAAEDSFDFSALFLGEKNGLDTSEDPSREALIHHSVNGSFAIRRGKWKLIPQKGNGGWTHGQSVIKAINEPDGQLYNMDIDPTESVNLWEKHPEIVKQLSDLLLKYKEDGRSIN